MAAKDEFFDAIYRGDVAEAEIIWRTNNLSANIKDSATGVGGSHALGYAVKLGAYDFAEELIANGADVNARGEDGMTPMFLASDARGVELLRRHNADTDIPLTRGGEQLSRGATALHRAAASSDADHVAALLRAGANVRAADRDGSTALHYAAHRDEAMVRVLVNAGADLDAQDKFGNTPRKSLAVAFPHFQMEPPVSTINDELETPSSESPDRTVEGVLLEHGAARYLNDPKNALSYFVKYQDGDGQEKTAWGVDLGRAMPSSGAQVGETVRLENTGRKTVVVNVPVTDKEGKVTGTEPKEVFRNAWIAQVINARQEVRANVSAEHLAGVPGEIDGEAPTPLQKVEQRNLMKLDGYTFVVGKTLETTLGGYHYLDRPEGRVFAFIPDQGSLDQIQQMKSAIDLKVHLERSVPDAADREAALAFYELSEELFARSDRAASATQDRIVSPMVPNAAPVSAIEAPNTISQAPVSDLRTTLDARMAKMNWGYGYSDDPQVRLEGAAEVQGVLKELETLAQDDRPSALALWEKYGVKHISPPHFLRDANEKVGVAPVIEATQADQPVAGVAGKKRAESELPEEDTIQPAPGHIPRPQIGPQEDAFLRAPSVAEKAQSQSAAESAEPHAQGSKEGPATLLNGRFIRRENGEYFRVADGQESKRIALVDESEKIRFVDKQMDAFQAAIELVKHKEWDAILVTGTEKFRSEAWHHARLAGLQVVGYEPTQKDLATLEAAQSRTPADRSADQANTSPLVSSRDVSESRVAARDLALKSGVGAQAPNVHNGRYAGKVIHETDHHIVQDVGKKITVVHEKSRFDTADLKKAIARGESVRVQYDKGRAQFDAGKDRQRAPERTR